MSEVIIKRKLTQKERNRLKVLDNPNARGLKSEAAKIAGITPQTLRNIRNGVYNTDSDKIAKLLAYASKVQDKLKTINETDKD